MRRGAIAALGVAGAALLASACIPIGPRPGSARCAGWSAPAATAQAAASTADAGSADPAPSWRDHARYQRWLADHCLRLNQIQVIGTHNSYHLQPREPLFSGLQAFLRPLADSIEYNHPPLADQFSSQGARQIELDVWGDPAGGLYSNRVVWSLFGLPTASGIPELDAPGLKVQHIADVDFESQCVTFVLCLQQVKSWSDANPRHLPIAILVEAKDDVTPDPFNLGFVAPVPFDLSQLEEVDTEIHSVFAARDLITPDDVRGSHATLEEAVLDGGWPTLGRAKGKVMFLLDNEGSQRTKYLEGHPSLEGRAMFVSSSPGQPSAAFVKENDPTGDNTATIQDIVRRGYVVRTRADGDTVQARTNDTSQRDLALTSGAQWVSTDYPTPADDPFSSYYAAIPDGHPARCNPMNTGPACVNTALE